MSARVLLVDDSPLVLDELSRMVTGDLGLEIAGTATHGLAAVDLAVALRPDLVSLDVQMPVMNGLSVLKHIMTRRPVATVMVSSFTHEDSHLTFDCLRCGAFDFVTKPSPGTQPGLAAQKSVIVARIGRAAAAATRPWYCRLRKRQFTPLSPGARARRLIVISGGRSSMAAVLKLVNQLPPGLETATIISLDVASNVVDSFAHYLARFASSPVHSMAGDTPLKAGLILLVPSRRPVSVVSRADGPSLESFEPSADAAAESVHTALFASVAEVIGKRTAGVLLSGAPPGSLAGLDRVRSAGGTAFAQSPDTALAPEGPEQARRTGLASRVADPGPLARQLVAAVYGETL